MATEVEDVQYYVCLVFPFSIPIRILISYHAIRYTDLLLVTYPLRSRRCLRRIRYRIQEISVPEHLAIVQVRL